MTDSPRSDEATASYPVELSESEVALVRTALRLLATTLGREEADELADVQALLARLPKVEQR